MEIHFFQSQITLHRKLANSFRRCNRETSGTVSSQFQHVETDPKFPLEYSRYYFDLDYEWEDFGLSCRVMGCFLVSVVRIILFMMNCSSSRDFRHSLRSMDFHIQITREEMKVPDSGLDSLSFGKVTVEESLQDLGG